MILSKYGVARHVYLPMVKRGVVDHAVSADWTPAAGDVKISKDGGAAANLTNLPTAIVVGNSTLWDFSLTATEMQAAQVAVTIADSAAKAIEDSAFLVQTHGNALAQFQIDLADAVRAGLTALPNANAEASGGLYTRGAGAGQITQDANGRLDGNAKAWVGGTIPAVNVSGVPLVDVKYILGTISPAAAGSLRADAVTGAVGSVSGAVASVTGNVGGNVVGSVGSVTGGVGGNVAGSVGSLNGLTASDVAAIKAKTDSLTFSFAGVADAQVKRVNGIVVTGSGTALTPWQPA